MTMQPTNKLQGKVANFIYLICCFCMAKQQMMDNGSNAEKMPLEIQKKSLYSHYQGLHCELTPIDDDSEEFLMIQKYMRNTHSRFHSNYVAHIVHIFRVSREGEDERFSKFASMHNRRLLWHGSRLTNWNGILREGLRIAPPEAPTTGYMFGKGIYFADMFSKSANYSLPTPYSAAAGVLALCEVSLGDMVELLEGNSDADKLPEGKLSTKGVGSNVPDPSEDQVLDDGVIVPLGRPITIQRPAGSQGGLRHNEFVVYNVDQIKIRYVVQVWFIHTENVPRFHHHVLEIQVFFVGFLIPFLFLFLVLILLLFLLYYYISS